MTATRHPVPGLWLLECAGVDDALAGDLAEGFAKSGSVLWYCRQAGAAIAVSWAKTLAMHRWLALRAVVTGWVVWAVFWTVTTTLRHVAVQANWVPLAITALRYGVWLVIGWAIGALHRPYAMPMVAAYVGFTLLMSIPAVSRAVVDVLGHPSYAPPSALMVVFAVISLMAGGALSAASVRHAGYASRATEPGR